MKLIIQTLDQKTFDVVVDNEATLLTLKNEISKLKEHQPDQLKLIYSGSVLDNDNMKLSAYKILEGTKIVLLLQKPKAKPVAPTPVVQTTATAPTLAPVAPVAPVVTAPAPTAAGVAAPATGVAAPQNMAHAFGAMLQQNPQAFMQLLMSDPLIAQIAQSQPQAFAQMLNDPNFMNNVLAAGDGLLAQGGEDESLYGKVFEGDIDLTDVQKKEVQDIVDMGFPFEDVVQYYVAYGHSKDLTVNALFDEKLDDDAK